MPSLSGNSGCIQTSEAADAVAVAGSQGFGRVCGGGGLLDERLVDAHVNHLVLKHAAKGLLCCQNEIPPVPQRHLAPSLSEDGGNIELLAFLDKGDGAVLLVPDGGEDKLIPGLGRPQQVLRLQLRVRLVGRVRRHRNERGTTNLNDASLSSLTKP